MKSAVAHTERMSSEEAANELVATCRKKLAGSNANAGMLFVACEYDHPIMVGIISSAFPEMQLIGCTTDGEVSSELRFREDSATLIVFSSDKVRFRAGLGHHVGVDAKAAAREAIAAAADTEGQEPSFCFTLPAGLVVSTTQVVSALTDQLGENFPIVGGVAGASLKPLSFATERLSPTVSRFFSSTETSTTPSVLRVAGHRSVNLPKSLGRMVPRSTRLMANQQQSFTNATSVNTFRCPPSIR